MFKSVEVSTSAKYPFTGEFESRSLERPTHMRTEFAGAVIIGLTLVLLESAATAAEPRKPNILIILADDLGYGELSCQGNPQIPTPNIDSIARNGIRFTSGYVSGPYCSPTRAGLLTGRYQQRFGHEFNPGPVGSESRAFGLSRDEATLAERLKPAGYATGIFGKWHLGDRPRFRPNQRGFDEFFGFLGGAHSYVNARADSANPIFRGIMPVNSIDYTTDSFGREAARFIEAHQREPWFVYLPFNAVHAPLEALGKYRARFRHIPDPRRRTFAAMLSAMDDNVGLVLSKIRALGLESDTFIVFVSDNGGPTRSTTSSNAPLNGYKAQVWEGGIRVPFLMQWKGHLPAGKIVDQPVIQLDLHPTALALAGVNVPAEAKLDGVNLLPYLTGENPGAPHEALFWRFGVQRAVRKGDWKLTDMGNGPKLFNLASDIGEKRDLAGSNSAKMQELEANYKAWNAKNIPARWVPRRNVRAALGNRDASRL
jgi:arylsulfatase A-like enzyme